ncbi:hypothetical protein PFISCL1PPCAC_6358, partial [Pristionchus fissidentatus]
MPRTAALITSVVFDTEDGRRISTVSTQLSDTEGTETKTGEMINIIHDANMDGVRHLKDGNKIVRYTWAAVIITFVILALLQIIFQIQFYYRNPIATNVEPSLFCRLTYITGAWLMNRNMGKEDMNSTISVFERVLLNAWDMDAVSFLKKASHLKSRMILGCTWPNGSACHLSDFRPVWTMTGLKIIIFNQTDVPETSLSGVNVPAGHSMDIPFKMQHRQKLTSSKCIEETEVEREATSNFSSPHNIRTCALRIYLREIERVCQCSFIKIFDQKEHKGIPLCTVGDYFKCVSHVILRVRESGKSDKCLPPCETVQFTGWQDMNSLPRNLMPPLIEDGEEEDEMDVEEEDIEKEFHTNEARINHITCNSNNIWLTDKQVGRIKREAHRAFEKTSRFQEDLVDPSSFSRNPERFKTIGGLKEYYGQRVEDLLREGNQIISAMEKLWAIFDASSYSSSITADLTRMDRIFELMQQYESGGLQRRVWAEKMESRQMRHFFQEEFMDGWSYPILRDLEKVLIKTISELESDEWSAVNKSVDVGMAGKIGATMFFSSSDEQKVDDFEKLLLDMYECATIEVKEESKKMLVEFKKAMRELQSAFNNLFKKELPEYLELYEFGDKFERENFAMVNIFMHEMHLEHWRQYETYSFWSLACDVGGALGLFVGASLLTIIEMIYLCIKHGICSRKSASEAFIWVRQASKRRNGRRVMSGVNEVDESIDDDVINEKKRS